MVVVDVPVFLADLRMVKVQSWQVVISECGEAALDLVGASCFILDKIAGGGVRTWLGVRHPRVAEGG